MSKPEKKAPELRFKGFTEDWEQRRLGEIVNIGSGRDYKHLSQGDIPVFGTGGYMLSVNEALSYDEDAIGIGRKGTIDNPYILKAPFWTVDTLFYVIPKENNSLNFIYNIFRNVNWKRMDESSGVPSLSKKTIENVKVMTPNLPEQQEIGSLFKEINSLITLHQRKYAALLQLKEAYLQNLFPSKGESVPKVRFANFSGSWEQRKVGEVFKVTRGQVLAITETSENKTEKMPYPVYSSQTKNHGLMGYYKDYLFDTAITWTTDGANAGTVNYRHGKFYSTNVNGVLLSDKGYANKAIAEAINLVAWKYVSRVGNPKLMNNVMSEIIISLPTKIEEQLKISEVLNEIDNSINLYEQKLHQLKKVKKAYLQKMFI